MLELNQVQFGYQANDPVIRDLSATLAAGELCVLLGPNAAGKSTLLKLMLGLIAPQRGSIALDGREVSALSAGQRATRMSYVPQRPRTHVAFTISEVVAMGRHALVPDEGAVDEAMRLCDLTSLRHRVFAELSVGQQQRVALARAIAQSLPMTRKPPAIMLLDEPVSAMDLRHVHDTMDLLAKLTKEGFSVLAALHDLNLAARYATKVWLMHEGSLVACGEPREVLTPAVLEPVYGIGLSAAGATSSGTPMLFVDASRRM